MMTIAYALSFTLGALAFTAIAIWLGISTLELLDEGYEDSPDWSFYKIICKPFTETYKIINGFFHRPSPLQREIMQEEKEIKDLEKQKADMERLDQLRERKERLFKEIAAEEVKPYTIDPLPMLRNEHYRWCVVCGSYFSGNHCDCLEDKEVRVYTPEQTANILDDGVIMEEAIKNHNKAMKNLRK